MRQLERERERERERGVDTSTERDCKEEKLDGEKQRNKNRWVTLLERDWIHRERQSDGEISRKRNISKE